MSAPRTETPMKANAGLWIDHREAVIVLLSKDGDVTKRVASSAEKNPRAEGPSNGQVPAGDLRDRAFTDHLARYYDEVIANLRDAGAILIFGPGEAKGELKKRFAIHRGDTRAISTEATDHMTEPQIAAKVRAHYGATG